ncbi:MAG: regulatory protein [Actinomycetota bacterium]|jgi:regulatory protein|nr:regulatory protein [Actinomycetota bacterium]
MATEMVPAQEALLDDDSYRDAMQRAGHLLASRPRSEHELRVRLNVAGYEPDMIDRTITRLVELRLLDDRAFAAQWVAERSVSKGRAGNALVSELVAKGVDRGVAEEAVAASGIDEEKQARELAARFLSKVASKPLEKQAEAVLGRLLRRGFSHDVARDAVRSVLPPAGWD